MKAGQPHIDPSPRPRNREHPTPRLVATVNTPLPGMRRYSALRWQRRLAAAALFPLLACQTVMQSERSRSQEAILAVVKARGEAAVMVALVNPPGYPDTADVASRRAAIARMQDELLATLDTADFRETKRFAAVPAVAGIVRSERGLRSLLSHPHVRQVSLDRGGGGGK